MQRGIRRMQQFLNVGGSLADRNSQAQADLNARAPGDDAASGNVAAHAFSQFPGLSQVAAGGNNQKFFAAATSYGIVRSDHRRDAARNNSQHSVARAMSATVVDGLE